MKNPTAIATIIARTTSTRLPLKCLRSIDSEHRNMLDFIVQRCRATACVSKTILCTSTEGVDDILADVALKNGCETYRGSADRVIERLIAVSNEYQPEFIIRITGDNVFTATEYLQTQIQAAEEHSLDYVLLAHCPLGATAEVIRTSALKDVHASIDPEVSEYMMLYLFDPKKYRCGYIKVSEKDYSTYNLSVDTQEDLDRTKRLLEDIAPQSPAALTLDNLLSRIDEAPEAYPRVSLESSIKYPYEKRITYQEYLDDMAWRYAGSRLIEDSK